MRDEAGTRDAQRATMAPLPEGVAGWSWGGFVFSWIWAIANGTPWGLLGIVPGVGLAVRVALGMKGREWAWCNRNWDSVDHFRRVQRRWSIAAVVVVLLAMIGIAAALTLPAHRHAPRHAGEQLEL